MAHRGKNLRCQAGFTLIEAMISILVLSFGVLSLAAVYAQGMYYANLTQYDYIAEKKAEQAVEAIFTARDTSTLTWSQIQNVSGMSGSDGGVFMDGPQPILVPGPDGLVGTMRDSGSADELITIGPNSAGQIGTSSDQTMDMNPWMTRTIQIIPVSGATNLRQITVTIDYHVAKMQRHYTLITFISSFA